MREAMEQIKYRNELKYLCSEQQLRLLEMRIKHLCQPDPHVGADGCYTVRSLYFDDDWNSCYYDNENGVDHRAKFRIRFYDDRNDTVTLECKEKRHGKNHKYVCSMGREQCEEILRGQFQVPENASPVLNQLFLKYRTQYYRPKVIVAYERTPYLCRVGNVRITFDRNIAASSRVRDFFRPRLAVRPVMPEGMQLLEIKYDELFPEYLYHEMQLAHLQMTSYSKYYMARKFTADFCK